MESDGYQEDEDNDDLNSDTYVKYLSLLVTLIPPMKIKLLFLNHWTTVPSEIFTKILLHCDLVKN